MKLYFLSRGCWLICNLVAVFSFSIIPVAWADQAAWISLEAAQKAEKFIKESVQILHYCQPCGEKSCKIEKVENVITKKVKEHTDPVYYEVYINGNAVDLAYVYVMSEQKQKAWTNLAVQCQIDVTKVSKTVSTSDQCFAANNSVKPKE